MKLSGTHINYYFHCRRHLWYFANSINMEQNSEAVAVGKFISDSSYSREEHDIPISTEDEEVVLDFYDAKTKTIHEVKKSDKMEDLHLWQVKFYISVLEKKGIEGVKGVIDYPRLKQNLDVELTEKDRAKLGEIKAEIKSVVESPIPPGVINATFCKNCSYYELCYI